MAMRRKAGIITAPGIDIQNLIIINPNDMMVPRNPNQMIVFQAASAPSPQSRSEMTPVIGHCIFCLRRLTNDPVVSTPIILRNARKEENNKLQKVSKADLQPSLVSTFNKLLPCLHKKWQKKGEDPSNPNLENITGSKPLFSESSGSGGGENSSLPKEFPHLPAMCKFCGDAFLEVDRIIGDLKIRILELKEIINSSKEQGIHSWRWEQFEKDLKNNQSIAEKSLKATFEFYEGFGVTENFEDESRDRNANEDSPVVLSGSERVKVEADENNDYIDESQFEEMSSMMQPFDSLCSSEDPLQDPLGSPAPPSSLSGLVLRKRKLVTSVVKNDAKRKVEEKQKKLCTSKCKPKRKVLKIQCYFCPQTVLSSEMKSHLQGHIRNYVCLCPNPCCDRGFSTPFKVERHLQTSRKCRKVVKPSCQCRLDKESQQGMSICKCKYEKECETCGFKTISAKKLKYHLYSTHEISTKKNFFCPIVGCRKGFTVRQSVYCHLDGWSHNFSATNINKSRQKCVKCGIFIYIDKMHDHLQTDHQTTEIIPCKVCKFLFPSWESLIQHMWTHHKNDPKSLTCNICNDGVKYAFMRSLEYHYYIKHKIGKFLPCDICQSSFFQAESLKIHRRIAHEGGSSIGILNRKVKTHGSTTSKKLFPCDVYGCQTVLSSNAEFVAHKLRIHRISLSKGFMCGVEGCGLEFSEYSTLEEHKLAVHLGVVKGKQEVEVMCEECGEYFSSASTLLIHQRIHTGLTGEPPHQCSNCGQSFRHSDALKSHMESHQN